MDLETTEIKGKVDFGIITIREDEFDAVLQRFPPRANPQGRRRYAVSHLQISGDRQYLIAVVRCPEPGRVTANSVTHDLIQDLDPQWILVTGIAGGVPHPEFTLGDVVAAIRLHDFSIGAAIEGSEPEHAIRGGWIHPAVQMHLAHLPALAKELRGWNTRESIGMARPPVDLREESFYGDEEWRRKVKETLKKTFGRNVKPRRPLVTTRSVASSDLLVKDSQLIKDWQQSARDVCAVEMELGGVYEAARQVDREYPVLAIRGISDIVGFRRDPLWTLYACKSAAAFTEAFLKTGPIKPRASDSSLDSAMPRSTGDERPDLENDRQDYLRSVFKENEYLDPRGIRQVVRAIVLQLDEIYVSLRLEQERNLPTTGRSAESDRQTIELPAAIRQRPRLVVLGDPGSGKTTLLRFLARLFSSAGRDGEKNVRDKDGQDYGSTALPVLVRIAEYADVLQEAKTARLREFLMWSSGDTAEKRTRFGRIIEDALKSGRALILLDGLDEVIDLGTRNRIAREIETFSTNLEDGNRIVVTSRIVGYREARLGAEFSQSVFTLCDMEPQHIERFLQRWCLAVARANKPDADTSDLAEQVQKEVRDLLRYIHASEGVQRLSVNPLLLTILALIRRASPTAPSHRAHLYKLASETLLHTWRIPQEPYSGSAILNMGQEELLLKPLAYEIHESEATGLISDSRARQFLQRTWARARGEDPDNPSPKTFDEIEVFMRCVNQHSGIFIERGPGKYGFLHLTFEEYFAGCEMVRLARTAVSRIHSHRNHSRWEEPIRLAIASFSEDHPEDAADLIRTAILGRTDARYPPSRLESILHRDLFFAARCIGDCVNPDAMLAKEVARELVEIYVDYKALGRPNPVRRRVEEALRALRNTAGADEAIRLLIQAFISSDRDEEAVRRRVIEGIGRFASATPQVHEFLIKALDDPSRNVRCNAIYALASLGEATPQVKEALRKKLRDWSPFVSAGAADALTRLSVSSAEAEHEATSALLGDDSEGWESAAEALSRLDQVKPEIVAKLLRAVRDRSDKVRGRAARALTIIGRSSPGTLASMRKAVHDAFRLAELAQDKLGVADTLALLGQSTPEVEKVLLNALTSKIDARRIQATRTLGIAGLGSPKIIASLCAALLHDRSSKMRAQAAEALGRLGQKKPEVTASLLQALQQDPDPIVRGQAASGLANLRIASEEALNALTRALADGSAYCWMSAAIALVELGRTDERAIERLQQFQALERYRFLSNAAWEALWNAIQTIDDQLPAAAAAEPLAAPPRSRFMSWIERLRGTPPV